MSERRLERRIHCPIDVCPWSHDVLSLDHVTEGTLASVFGVGVMMATAHAQREQAVERALETHLKSHSILDWVQCIQRLKLTIAAQDHALKEHAP